MRHHSRPKFESTSGQSLIIVALLMVGMIAALGLALDGGNAFVSRRKSQNAADAAAFAGVRLLATRTVTATEPAIWTAITTLAMANGVITTTDITAWFIDEKANNICVMPLCGGVPANATGVRVTTKYQMQPYFIDVLIGKNKVPLQAIAAVQSGPPVVASKLMPMAIKFPCPWNPAKPLDEQGCEFHFGLPAYRLFGSKEVNGGFQWTSYICSSDSPTLVDYLRLVRTSGDILADPGDVYYNPLNPTQYNLPPPDPNPWVCSGPGVKNDAGVSAALDCWLFPNSPNCWLNYSLAPRKYPGPGWTVPVFDVNNGPNPGTVGKRYHTVLFAEFEFKGYWFGPNQCNWLGKTADQDCGCTNDPLYPKFKCPSNRQPITPDLEECLVGDDPTDPCNPLDPLCKPKGIKCLMGYFKQQVVDFEIKPGECNKIGLDICGVGMSQ